MALRQIRLFDDEILRKKSKVVEIVDYKIRQILDDRADTMYNAENSGELAATSRYIKAISCNGYGTRTYEISKSKDN